MKLPKGGFTSFETNDICSKCGNELKAFRESFKLTPIVMPARVREKLAEEYADDAGDQEAAAQEGGNDMFSFDLPHHDDQIGRAHV